MRTNCLIFLFICATFALVGQIVNIEKKRINADTSGWFGDVNLSFAAQRNIKNVFSIASGIQLAYYGQEQKLEDLKAIHKSSGQFNPMNQVRIYF